MLNWSMMSEPQRKEWIAITAAQQAEQKTQGYDLTEYVKRLTEKANLFSIKYPNSKHQVLSEVEKVDGMEISNG